MKKDYRIIMLLSICVIAILFYNGMQKEDTPNVNADKTETESIQTHKFYKIKALALPDNLNLAGERVPIEINDVKERMERELLVNTYWQSNGILLIKRAHKYFPILEPLLKNTIYQTILNF
jgi:hypothetical protein